MKSIISYKTAESSHIKVKLADILASCGITRSRLSTLIDVKYSVIDRYHKGQNIALADFDFLAKCCYVLDCKIADWLEYQKP